VAIFRHAMAIDERRSLFRLSEWQQPQPYRPNPFAPRDPAMQQDIKQIWFAGAHGDVGGGHPETESGLAKHPLLWMAREAAAAGLRIDPEIRDHVGAGEGRPGATRVY